MFMPSYLTESVLISITESFLCYQEPSVVIFIMNVLIRKFSLSLSPTIKTKQTFLCTIKGTLDVNKCDKTLCQGR